MGYLIAAIVSFCLAGCSLVACVIIFFKLKVADAIRFLRGLPMRGARPASGNRVKAAPLFRRGSNRTTATAKASGNDASTASGTVPEGRRVADRPASAGANAANVSSPAPASEQPTQVAGTAQGSESPTMVGAEASENPTVVGMAASENPTVVSVAASESPTVVSVVADDDGEAASERPTVVVAAEPSEALGEEAGTEPESAGEALPEAEPLESEGPTVVAAAGSERPTVAVAQPGDGPSEAPGSAAFVPSEASIVHDEARAGVAQQSEPSFRFTLRHNQVVVHTDEVID
ncbi:MAG TPA: hypothetical protein IAC12_10245 [Candidatus Aphodovivens avistercoris]|nr:hypothetical protein [Candidatus Aphodovivens avistercoris]